MLKIVSYSNDSTSSADIVMIVVQATININVINNVKSAVRTSEYIVAVILVLH